jgi:hypothetical protein
MGNAYNNASLLVTPNGYKASKIYSAKPTDGTGDLAFSRASTAMRRNSAGLWEEVANNVPRLQYPVGGGCPSWLFEPQATNILQQSNNISSLVWNRSEIPVMQGASGNIAGVNDYSILEQVGFGYARIYQDITNAIYTYSIRIKFKIGGRSWLKVDTNFVTYFNIELGTIGNIGAGCTASITDDGNGYYLCKVTETVARDRIYIGATTANGVDGFTGDGRESFLISNIQVEAGSVATSPIITAGSAVTRLKDDSSVVLPSVAEGTVYGEVIVNGSGYQPLIFLDDNTGDYNNRIDISSSSGVLRCSIDVAGVTLINATGGTFNVGLNKFAVVFTSGTCKGFLNGALVFTAAPASIPTLTRLKYLCRMDITSNANGSELIKYNTTLSDSEAIELTTI